VQASPNLDVYAGEQLAGTLARSQLEEEAYLFGYVDGCRDEDAVSLTMPVVRDQYDSMNGLLPGSATPRQGRRLSPFRNGVFRSF
jgi:hypothetical protein